MVMLDINNLSYSFKNKRVLNDINISVNTGEILCILGPNGSGKTTLLNCITACYSDYKGEMKAGNVDLKKVGYSDRAKMIAYVPQITKESFPYSVFDSILMGRTPYIGLFGSPSKVDEEIVDSVIKDLNIEDLRDRPFNELSGGESQLVKIGRGLAQQAKIQIMDEPTGALDLHNELQILETITRVVGEKENTVIMATHYPNQPLYFENKGLKVTACLMKNGEVRYQGKPSEVITEESLRDIYNIDAQVIDYRERSGMDARYVVPVMKLDMERCFNG